MNAMNATAQAPSFSRKACNPSMMPATVASELIRPATTICSSSSGRYRLKLSSSVGSRCCRARPACSRCEVDVSRCGAAIGVDDKVAEVAPGGSHKSGLLPQLSLRGRHRFFFRRFQISRRQIQALEPQAMFVLADERYEPIGGERKHHSVVAGYGAKVPLDGGAIGQDDIFLPHSQPRRSIEHRSRGDDPPGVCGRHAFPLAITCDDEDSRESPLAARFPPGLTLISITGILYYTKSNPLITFYHVSRRSAMLTRWKLESRLVIALAFSLLLLVLSTPLALADDGETYVVQVGDTLALIAEANEMSVSELVAINQLRAPISSGWGKSCGSSRAIRSPP